MDEASNRFEEMQSAEPLIEIDADALQIMADAEKSEHQELVRQGLVPDVAEIEDLLWVLPVRNPR